MNFPYYHHMEMFSICSCSEWYKQRSCIAHGSYTSFSPLMTLYKDTFSGHSISWLPVGSRQKQEVESTAHNKAGICRVHTASAGQEIIFPAESWNLWATEWVEIESPFYLYLRSQTRSHNLTLELSIIIYNHSNTQAEREITSIIYSILYKNVVMA